MLQGNNDEHNDLAEHDDHTLFCPGYYFTASSSRLGKTDREHRLPSPTVATRKITSSARNMAKRNAKQVTEQLHLAILLPEANELLVGVA